MGNRERLTFEGAMDERGFIDNLAALLTLLWGNNWGHITMKRPSVNEDVKDVPMPIIVFGLKDVEPAKLGQSETRELKPRFREQIVATNEETGEEYYVNLSGRRMEYLVEFTIYGQDNKEAMELSRDFRDVLDTYKGVLMKKGMQNMWFLKEYERSTNESRRDTTATRGIDYKVILEELTVTNPRKIEEVELSLDTVRERLMKEQALPSQEE